MFRDFFGDRYDREREAPKQRGSGSSYNPIYPIFNFSSSHNEHWD